MKRILLIIVLIALLFTTTANATVLVVKVTPKLSFTGTTANCEARVTDAGKYISATLELYENGTSVETWNASGYSSVTFSDTYSATSGKSYYLRLHGTSGGSAFDESTTVKVCP